MGWLAYCAMATAILPLLCMAVGYLYVTRQKRDGR
jgi:hypothetical protein